MRNKRLVDPQRFIVYGNVFSTTYIIYVQCCTMCNVGWGRRAGLCSSSSGTVRVYSFHDGNYGRLG